MAEVKWQVKVDGETVLTTDLTVSYPDGGGGSSCSFTLADNSVAISPDAEVEVWAGYVTSRGWEKDKIFTTELLDRTQLSIEPHGDTVTVGFGSKLERRHDLAPDREQEVWYPRGGGLRALLSYVCVRKIGYSGVRTNIPNLPIAREVVFTAGESYWSTLQTYLEAFKPLILPDDVRGILYVWSLDFVVEGKPYAIRQGVVEADARPVEYQRTINQALLKYFPSGNSGAGYSGAPTQGSGFPGPGGPDPGAPDPDAEGPGRKHHRRWGRGTGRGGCGPLVNTYDDPSGWVLGTTATSCGDTRVQPEESEDGRIVFRDYVAYENEGDGGGLGFSAVEALAQGYTRTRTTKACWENAEGDQLREPVPVRKVITTYGPDDLGVIDRVMETEIHFYYLGGTDFQTPSGHYMVSRGLVDEPGIGRIWEDKIEEESQSITYRYTQDDPTTPKKDKTVTRTAGQIVRPDDVPLKEAANNGLIAPGAVGAATGLGASTYQWLAYGRLKFRIESLESTGTNSIGYVWKELNYLTGRWKRGDAGDAIGRYPKGPQRPDPAPELYQDPEAPRDPATDKLIDPTAAEPVDTTPFGPDATTLPDGEPSTVSREWAVALADAKFRRSGKGVKRANVTTPKLLTRLARGALVRLTLRQGAAPRDYVVTGMTVRLGVGASGIGTEIQARRLGPADED